MRNSRSAFIRAEAGRILKEADVTGPPVPIDDLVIGHGLAIHEDSTHRTWGAFHEATWSIRLSPRLYRETPSNRNRRRFTLAHELGHCLLKHGDQSCWNLGGVAEPVDLADIDDLPDSEQEAHQFARELLLPRPWLKRDWEQDATPAHWEALYGVSHETFFIVLTERRLLMARRTRR